MSETITNVITGCSAEVYEFLHNIVQDAQATGAIVNIITIIPNETPSDDFDEGIKCKPKATTCPKT